MTTPYTFAECSGYTRLLYGFVVCSTNTVVEESRAPTSFQFSGV
jgi:hypothetical protein